MQLILKKLEVAITLAIFLIHSDVHAQFGTQLSLSDLNGANINWVRNFYTNFIFIKC